LSCLLLVKNICDALHSIQARRERKKKFLDPDTEPLDIDAAMGILLEVGEQEFKDNVELYGAVHTDELRCSFLSPF